MKNYLGIFTILGHVLLCLRISYGYDKLSTGKGTWMSSTIVDPIGFPYAANLAIDGQFNKLTYSGRSCALSFPRKLEATWMIDLGGIRSIMSVQIYYRNDDSSDWDNTYRGRFAGFFLYVSNTNSKEAGHVCYHEIQNGTNSPPPVFTVPCVTHGRYIIYYNERKSGTTYPSYYYTEEAFVELCEVVVLGCSQLGVYGNNCNQPCPTNCQEQKCSIDSGECLSCKDGYIGNICNTPCSAQYYGQGCKQKCGNCLGGVSCYHVNGSCLKGCAAGWQEDNCLTPCGTGTYGLQCKGRCSVNCKPTKVCNPITGKCDDGCKDGFQGDKCDRKCDSKMYGANCSTPCGTCIDGNQCHHTNGRCLTGCAKGFKGNTCTTECEPTKYGENCRYNCSIANCVNQTCNGQTGVCIQSFHHNTELESSSVVSIIAGILAAIIAIAIVTVVIFMKRTRRGKDSSGERNLQETSTMTSHDSHGISRKRQKVDNNNKKSQQSITERQTGPKSSGKLMTPTIRADAADELEANVYEGLQEEGLYERQYATCAKYSDVSDIKIDNLADVIKEMSKNDIERFKVEYPEEYHIFTQALSAHIQNRTKNVYYNM